MRYTRKLLSRQDWVYLLSLLVPFAFYDLFIKAYDVASRPGDPGFAETFSLMRSDLFFNACYALLWIGLFTATRSGGLLRRFVVLLFHAATVLVVSVTTIAHRYYQENGTTLDYGTIAEWLPKFGEIVPILARDVPLLAWAVLSAALLYAALGPWLLTRIVQRRQGRSLRSTVRIVETSLLGSLGLWLLALGFGFLSLLIGPADSSQADVGKSFARDPFVNVVVTGVEEATAQEGGSYAGPTDPVSAAAGASLTETPQTEKRNVVMIHLESTRAQSTTPYDENLNTTPFLNELSKKSLLAEKSYVVVPRSSKGSVAANCGVEPPLYPGPEFEPDGIPVPCLPDLLKEQGYSTAFFASTSDTMDNFGDVAQGFGYEEVYMAESMDTTDYQVTNTFGYEDDMMLGPSEEWLRNRDESRPFMAEYFTGTGHYGYECSSLRTGFENFVEDDPRVEDDEELNRYLNCLRYQDSFLQELINQYKEMGLYEDTIFVVFGDHGQGFGEHGRFLHGDTIYEEGLRMPLIVHDPKRFQNGERVKGLSSQIDILPTVVEMLGYEVGGGEYPGYSLLREPPEDRTLRFSCITNRKCLASLKGDEKYIYHYGDQPDELFDLSEDPLEQRNLAGEYGKGELDRRREDLLAWRSRINAEYDDGSGGTSDE